MTGLGIRNLLRRPQRTLLTLLGIAVTSAMLLDMVLLAGGIEKSFEQLLLSRGYEIRVSPKGTLPFDTEGGIAGGTALVRALRAEPGVVAVAPLLGSSIHVRVGDGARAVTGYGVDPVEQSMYELEGGRDLARGDSTGILLSAAAATMLGARLGDTLTLVGGLDPQLATSQVERRLVVRGTAHWLYDYRDQPSVGMLVPALQDLTRQRHADRLSALSLRLASGSDPARIAARLRSEYPALEINNVADLVRQFRTRLVYFRQLSYILGTISLGVTLLLVGTLLTITVNERLAEIATLRAIGISRMTIVASVIAEGTALTVAGGALGTLLGLATARYLDRILTSFPGLPAAISFFVPRAESLAVAALVLAGAGCLAGALPAWRAAAAPIATTLKAEST
jgi:putative ABC transport system permease protein